MLTDRDVIMYVVYDGDKNKHTIERLSKLEKDILMLFAWYIEENGWGRGHSLFMWTIIRDLQIKHRASLSRVLRTLDKKGLVGLTTAYKGEVNSRIDKDGKVYTDYGTYAKVPWITDLGEQVAKILKERGYPEVTGESDRPAQYWLKKCEQCREKRKYVADKRCSMISNCTSAGGGAST